MTDETIENFVFISFISGGIISIYLLANPELSFWVSNPMVHIVFLNILELGIWIFLFLVPFAVPAILMMFLLGLPIGILYLLLKLLILKLKG